MNPNTLYVGLKSHVAAVDKRDGRTLWKTQLKGGLTSGESFVTVLVENGRVYAHTCGELFCLDARTGAILWNNGLPGLGYGIASLATESASAPTAPGAAQAKASQASSSAAVTASTTGK